MKIEVVTIGDELLLGYTIDTNAAHLARVLAGEGGDFTPHHMRGHGGFDRRGSA
jgi:molybdopterin-biosynthesis enzyme MoeA-like protein